MNIYVDKINKYVHDIDMKGLNGCNKKTFGQYYSPKGVADLSLRFVEGDVTEVIDLAAGVGDLLAAARDVYPKIDTYAFDVDGHNVARLLGDFGCTSARKLNALDLPRKIQAELDLKRFDLVVGNPPFNKQQVSKWTLGIIQDELGLDYSGYSSVRAEVAFLALSLHFARSGGYVSLVLPKAIAYGIRYESLRNVLIGRHSLSHVIDLPPSTFEDTEAETSIFVLRKNIRSRRKITLMKSDRSGRVQSKVLIPASAGVHRLDHDYHIWRRASPASSETLSDIGAAVYRGSIHSKKAQEQGLDIFHTSDFSKVTRGVVHFDSKPLHTSSTLVKGCKNDILLPRVGRSLHQSALVGSGESIISDCVLCLRIPRKHLSRIRDSLASDATKEWLRVHTFGTCAKIITKNDVLRMPIFT